MENYSELLTRKNENLLRKINTLDSTSSSFKPKKLKLRNEISSLMKFSENTSPKKILDFPICLSLFTNNQTNNQDNKKKEKKQSKLNINFKNLKPKNLNNLNLNDFIKPNNKKLISRNEKILGCLSPIKSKNNNSSFTRFFSPARNNSTRILLNKLNNSPSNLLLQQKPIIINNSKIGLSSPRIKITTNFNNLSTSTIGQETSIIKNIKGLSINNLNYNINFNDRRFMPSIFSSPSSVEILSKGNIEKKNNKKKIYQIKKKMQYEINNFDYKTNISQINNKIKKNKKIKNNETDIKNKIKKETKISENQKENDNEDNTDEDKNKFHKFSSTFKEDKNNTFFKASPTFLDDNNLKKQFDIPIKNKFSSHQVIYRLDYNLNNNIENNNKLILNDTKLEKSSLSNNNKIISNKSNNNQENIVNDNKEKIARLSRLKNSSLKKGNKIIKKSVNFGITEEESKNENKEKKKIAKNRKKTEYTSRGKGKNEKKNTFILDENKEDKIKRAKSSKSIKVKDFNLYNIKKNKFYLTICKMKINEIYSNNKFLKKKNKQLNEISNNNRTYRQIYIKKATMLLDFKEKVNSIINNEKSHLNFPENTNNISTKDAFIINKIKHKDENLLNKYKIQKNFICNLNKCLNNFILLTKDFNGFSNNILSTKRKKNTFIRRNKIRRMTKTSFKVQIKRLSVIDLQNRSNNEQFSINKTKNTCVDELEWLYSPINLLSIQEMILRSNDYYYGKKDIRSDQRRQSTMRRLSHSLNYNKKDREDTNTTLLRQLSLSKKLNNLNFTALKKNLKKASYLNNFSILNQKKFFKRNTIRVDRNKNKINKTEFKSDDDKSSNNSLTDRLISIDNDNNLEDIYFELLSYIIESKNKQFFKFFEKNKSVIDINQKLLEGNTLLIISAREGNLAISKFLCDKGIQVNIQNNEGNTALHYAIGNQFYSIADILTRHGAREDISNNKGLLPWDCLGNNLD